MGFLAVGFLRRFSSCFCLHLVCKRVLSKVLSEQAPDSNDVEVTRIPAACTFLTHGRVQATTPPGSLQALQPCTTRLMCDSLHTCTPTLVFALERASSHIPSLNTLAPSTVTRTHCWLAPCLLCTHMPHAPWDELSTSARFASLRNPINLMNLISPSPGSDV